MNDYERYDFWHREMESLTPDNKRSMKKQIESVGSLEEKNSYEARKSDDIGAYVHSIVTDSY